MPKFEPDRRLLQLLVGSNLYPSADVCVRELLQNAWDAILWRRERADEGGGRIVIRYSQHEGWFEVEDDGIGMDRHDVIESFLKVGRDKYEALGADRRPSDQIALFGIGVLSVFLVADRIEVETWKVGTSADEAVRLSLNGIDDDEDFERANRSDYGTRFRLQLKSGAFPPAHVPEAARRYARHVPGIALEDADTRHVEEIGDRWDTDGQPAVREITLDDSIRQGRVALEPGLLTGQPIANRITLCNAGFFVERALDLLALPHPLGVVGEVDLHPGALAILMARGQFQRDQAWQELGRALLEPVLAVAQAALADGPLTHLDGRLDESAVRRALFIWFWVLSQRGQDELCKAVAERIRTTVGFTVADRDRPAGLEGTIAALPAARLYYRRTGTAATQRSRQITDEGFPIHVTEEVRDSVKVAALRARGFPVLEFAQLPVTFELTTGASSQTIDELAVIQQVLAGRGIELLDISNTRAEDVDFSSIEKAPLLRRLLDVHGLLAFADFPDSTRRVITDPSGVRWLNTRHPSVARLLRVIADAVSNPLRRRLLSIYLGLEDFRLTEARAGALELLESQELAALATAEVAPLSSTAVAAAITLQQELGAQ